ncbi:MAG TPA: hypothetical protein VLA91_02775 [Acidimicrobiia bacterium]|nr:hypothetical protein [Acidimicrobiia bacterium]
MTLTTRLDVSDTRLVVGQLQPPELRVVGRAAVGETIQHEVIEDASEADSEVNVSLTPELTIRNATPNQRRRLLEAVGRFEAEGMLIPDLAVEFRDDASSCGGHYGLFSSGFIPWGIKICSELGSVFEHELAHAWELSNLSDETRQQFMELRGYETWADKSVPWNERGVEGVALIIQQGLAGFPLPPYLSREHQSRVEAFELLTGQESPQLLEWCSRQDLNKEQAREVCSGIAQRLEPFGS